MSEHVLLIDKLQIINYLNKANSTGLIPTKSFTNNEQRLKQNDDNTANSIPK